MNSLEKVSIIVPVYNLEDFVSKCIESIICQTYKNIEILIIDDGSTDESGKICDQYSNYDSRIHVFHLDNAGVASARNYGITHANGQYISFVDADDWIEPNMIEEMVNNIGDCDLISVGVIWERQEYSNKIFHDSFEERKYAVSDMAYLLSNFIYSDKLNTYEPLTPWLCNKLFKKDILLNINFSLCDGVSFAEDSMLLILYFIKCRSIRIEYKPLYHYLKRNGSAFNQANPNRIDEILKRYHRLNAIFDTLDPKYDLKYQLQMWVINQTLMSYKSDMLFDQRVGVFKYCIDLSDYKDMKIIAYGAGKAGKDIVEQILRENYNLVAWVDSNFATHLTDIYPVSNPLVIRELEFDYILVTVLHTSTYKSIMNDLISMGIDKNKIIWHKPVKQKIRLW